MFAPMSSNILDFFPLLAFGRKLVCLNTLCNKITVPVLLSVQKVSSSLERHIDLKALILAWPHSCLYCADYILG